VVDSIFPWWWIKLNEQIKMKEISFRSTNPK
jgi:hypothetical protein